MAYEFKFPDIGEGIAEGELLSWKVKEGDQVAQDQTLAEMETDKAVVEMPSPRAGKVLKLHAAEGDIVNVGDVLVTIEEGAPAEAAAEAAPQAAPAAPSPVREPAQAAPSAVPKPEPAPAARPPPNLRKRCPTPGRWSANSRRPPKKRLSRAAPTAQVLASEEAGVLAMPSVRVLAKELGVDLGNLRGTGPGGRILKQDVEDMAEAVAYGTAVAATSAQQATQPAPAAAVRACRPPPPHPRWPSGSEAGTAAGAG